MVEFLLEILSEEIPARMQRRAQDDLKNLLKEELSQLGLSFSAVNTFVTPRRLVAVVEGLPLETVGSIEERRGPKVGSPEGAIQGFLRSVGLPLEACVQRDGYYYAHLEMKPRATRDILPDAVRLLFTKLTWQKSMFWALKEGAKSQFWVRPVRSVLTVLEGQALSFDLPTLGLTTSNRTQGHRFLAPDGIEVSSFADYQARLEKAFVILDHQERQTRIWEGLEALAHQKGLALQADDALLQEVAGLVEYPVPLLGQIDPQFMNLPAVVLSTSMRVHQKYFTVVDRQGVMAPYFGVVANTKGADGGAAMIAGYERVLRARLSDAAFFYAQDVKVPLEDLSTRLHNIVFHAQLGTLGQKVDRLKLLLKGNGPDRDALGRAATLAKADLLTTMVGEFPELQGTMGEIYALVQGEDPAVAAAIREHYQPQGPNDPCPTAPVSVALALADKMDTLVGFFGIGEVPTGSKDPYALRRAALGIIRLIRENELSDWSLKTFAQEALKAYQAQGITFKTGFDVSSVLDFINERLKVALRAEGIRHDCVAAVMDRKVTAHSVNIEELEKSRELDAWEKYIERRCYDANSLFRRAQALQPFLQTSSGLALSVAFRRIHGIVIAEMEKDKYFYIEVKPELLKEEQELDLYNQLETILKNRDKLLDAHDYEGWLDQLATLRPYVDAFFDTLMVNDKDKEIRANRLRLLGKLRIQTEFIADFSKIEG